MVSVSELPDKVLVQRIKESACSESFNELSRRHSNLFYKVCQGYIKTLTSLGCLPSDIFEDKDIVLFEAALRFNPDKGALFSTWLGNYTRYFCLNKINRCKNMPELSSEDEIEAVFDNTSIEEFANRTPDVDLVGILNALKDTNDPRITNIFKLRYDPSIRKKRTWANIADQLNLTVQTTIQLHKKGLKLLREKIATENLDVFQDA